MRERLNLCKFWRGVFVKGQDVVAFLQLCHWHLSGASAITSETSNRRGVMVARATGAPVHLR